MARLREPSSSASGVRWLRLAVTSRNPYGRIVMGNAAWGALFGWLFDLGHTGRTTVYPVKPARPSEP